MKPKNFPARKLARQLKADIRKDKDGDKIKNYTSELRDARDKRSKKKRKDKRR